MKPAVALMLSSALAVWAIAAAAEGLRGTWVDCQIRRHVGALRAVAVGDGPAGRHAGASAFAAAVSIAAGVVLWGPRAAFLIGLAVFWLTGRVGKSARAARSRRIERSLPVALRSLADGLAAGLSLGDAALAAGSGGVGPAGDGLKRFSSDMSRGASIDRALARLVSHGECPHWESLASAVELHRRAGGDLPGSVKAIAEGIEDLLRGREEARSVTAQARFTSFVVAGLWLLSLVGGVLLSPGSAVAVFHSAPALAMVAAAVMLQLAGGIVIRRLGGVRSS